jgi:hypothetical protein
VCWAVGRFLSPLPSPRHVDMIPLFSQPFCTGTPCPLSPLRVRCWLPRLWYVSGNHLTPVKSGRTVFRFYLLLRLCRQNTVVDRVLCATPRPTALDLQLRLGTTFTCHELRSLLVCLVMGLVLLGWLFLLAVCWWHFVSGAWCCVCCCRRLLQEVMHLPPYE